MACPNTNIETNDSSVLQRANAEGEVQRMTSPDICDNICREVGGTHFSPSAKTQDRGQVQYCTRYKLGSLIRPCMFTGYIAPCEQTLYQLIKQT